MNSESESAALTPELELPNAANAPHVEPAGRASSDVESARVLDLGRRNEALELNEQALSRKIADQITEAAKLRDKCLELETLLVSSREENGQFRQLFELAPIGYLLLDANGIIKTANLAGTCIFSKPRKALEDTAFSDYVNDADKQSFRDALTAATTSSLALKAQVELLLSGNSQRAVMLVITARRAKHSAAMDFLVMIVDISDQLKTEKLLRNANGYLEELAHRDPLTHLPNRIMFNDHLESLLLKRSAQRSRVGVIYFDLVAQRLTEHLGQCDIAARIGGDEFTVLLDNPNSTEDAARQADTIRQIINRPIATDEGYISVSCSMGLSLYPDHATKIEDLVRGADAAMYQAKHSSRDQVQLFTRESVDTASRLSQIETSLPLAVKDNQLEP